MASRLQIGLVGAGENTRKRHIPGLRDEPDVEIVAVCNRRAESTERVAQEYSIPRTFAHWQDLVADPEVDAIVIGTWPYLHCPIALAAFQAGKHVLTEARMSMNAVEAHQMREASRAHPHLVAQIVPSPFGLTGDRVIRDMIESDYLGELREYQVYGQTAALADPESPLSWRQDAGLSGFNTLTLGILHETILRWLPQPQRVFDQARAFIPERLDADSGIHRAVGTPDSIQALTRLPSGASGTYQVSGVTPFGGGMGVQFLGSKGAITYDLSRDRVHGTRQAGPLEDIPISPEKAGGWRVEADFVRAIRDGVPVGFTNFDAGVAYMEFTEAVARSAVSNEVVVLPLADLNR